jgi:DNA-binding transcriptional LysR family regulator
MTILQLKYVIEVANSSSLSEAAGRLFISQPALSTSIKELEEELGITLFERTNRGIRSTDEAEDFLAYAKQAVSQYQLIEDRYLSGASDKVHFNVSMQHYVFAVHAFVKAVQKFDNSKYIYSVNETRTSEVLTNVRDLRSEVGIISFSQSNEKVMRKILKEINFFMKVESVNM